MSGCVVTSPNERISAGMGHSSKLYGGALRIARSAVHGFLLFAAAGSAAAQSSADTVYHLHGAVVNGATGKPIGHALVESADRRLATMTNSEGNWSLEVSVPPAAQSAGASGTAVQGNGGFSGIAAGGVSLRLMAQRPGYLQDEEQTSVVLAPGMPESSIDLQLLPAAVIRGTVDLPAETPRRGLSVQLLRRGVQDGRVDWVQVSGAPLQPDGSFRMGDLRPGEYTVMVLSFAPPASGAEQTSVERIPVTFLGDTASLAAATKLHLGYGQVAQADLHPQAVPYYRVAIPISTPLQNVGVNARVERDGQAFGMNFLRWDTRAGRVEGLLPSGDYTVLLQSFGANPAAATVPLHVANGPVELAAVALSPATQIPVLVHDERTGTGTTGATSSQGAISADSGFNLFLRAANHGPAATFGNVQRHDGGTFVEGVPPGPYDVQAYAHRGYVAQLTSGRIDLLHDPLIVSAAGADPIEITLRDDTGTVTGTVSGADTAALGTASSVLLLPVDAPSQRMLTAGLGEDGSFTLSNVPPGGYRAVLVSRRIVGEGIPFRDADAMRAMEEHGIGVSVQPGQTSSITLSASNVASEPQ